MKAYIINLSSSIDRRSYMEEILKPFRSIDKEFINGINGRKLSDIDIEKLFDQKKAFELYGRLIYPGEIGCTLSHQKCYSTLLNSLENYVLIFEDDVIVQNDIEKILKNIEKYINIDEPTIILLSGYAWSLKKEKIDDNYQLASVYDAYYAHSYLINRAAAKLLLNPRPEWIADNWRYLRLNKGIKIKSLIPHIVDQSDFNSTISTNRKLKLHNDNFKQFINICYVGVIKKLLKFIGYYEPKQINKSK
jgi:glycosyl transferase family 25